MLFLDLCFGRANAPSLHVDCPFSLMLRTSSVWDASTCLRCNLRLVLRQIQQRRYQSSDELPLPLRHAQFPTPALEEQHNDQTSRLRVVRTHANHGRIRGKKGGQRRVESSEALSIASLGQSSEISSARGELQDLTRTPWHPGITAATKRLPITRSAMDSQFAKGRKMNNKEYVIESGLYSPSYTSFSYKH